MVATLWEVAYYGNGCVVERYVGRFGLKTEWVGGWNSRKCRPHKIFTTLESARAARDKANPKNTPISPCCGTVLPCCRK